MYGVSETVADYSLAGFIHIYYQMMQWVETQACILVLVTIYRNLYENTGPGVRKNSSS